MLRYVNMNARAVIGKVNADKLSEFIVRESVNDIGYSAKIVLPLRATVGEEPVEDHLRVGDRVAIYAGYDGREHQEFSGYVRRIEVKDNITLECDQLGWILKKNRISTSYRNASLADILSDIIPEELPHRCDDVMIGSYMIDNVNAYDVLDDLCSRHGLRCHMEKDVLHVGLAYMREASRTVEYDILRGVKKNELQAIELSDKPVRYKAISILRTGRKIEVSVGSTDKDAEERTLHFHDLNEYELKKKAEDVLHKEVNNGYSGSLTGFGYPIAHAGDTVAIKDGKNGEAVRYLIDNAEITFNRNNGFSRKITLGFRV